MKICFVKLLGFDRMHENKIFFLFLFFCFLKEETNFKFFEIFLNFFEKHFRNISEKTRYFHTEFVSYSVNKQLDIIQI